VEVSGGWGRFSRSNLPQPPPSFTNLHNLPFAVEARGIEPRSENDSDTAPTCVDKALEVSPSGRLAGPGGN